MTLVIRRPDGILSAPNALFESEIELERILTERVELLQAPADARLAFVDRQVKLADAGTLDMLCVDEEGLPVAVEVKLGRNGESRRSVVAQIVDYLSALTAMTVDELDEQLDGKLEAALRSFDEESEDDGFEGRWKAVAANLRAGLARITVAIDSSASDLRRLVRFLSDHSKLNIRLVEISKFVESGVGVIYAPNFVVGDEERPGLESKPPKVPCEVFLGEWRSKVNPAIAGAWDHFIAALRSAKINGLRIDCYSSGIPRIDLESKGQPVGLMRLSNPRVSPGELRDLLHKGWLWKDNPRAEIARKAFRSALLELVPGARVGGDVGRVYVPIEGLQSRTDDVVAAIAQFAREIT